MIDSRVRWPAMICARTNGMIRTASCARACGRKYEFVAPYV